MEVEAVHSLTLEATVHSLALAATVDSLALTATALVGLLLRHRPAGVPAHVQVADMVVAGQVACVDSLGKTLVVMGLVLAAVGALLWLFGRSGGGFLPGDIVVEKKNVRFYFPIVTCLVLSLVLSLIAWLMRR